MKKLFYILPIVFSILIFAGCHRQEGNKIFTCTPEEKENQFCNYYLDPVCGDDGETYGNACIACSSNNIDSYKMGECQFCDDENGICSIGNIRENNENEYYGEKEIKEIKISVPTPDF